MLVPTRGEGGRDHPSISPNWKDRSLLIPTWCGEKSFLVLLRRGIHPLCIILVIPKLFFPLGESPLARL